MDRTGTFLGSMWESRTNVATVLLEAGLAKMQTSFGADRIVEAHILEQAERSAKNQKLKVRQATHVFLVKNKIILLNRFLIFCRFGRTMLKDKKSQTEVQPWRLGRRRL